jgi:hypothetical protein
VVQVIHSDDEVSSDNDVPLQRRMRVAGSGGSATDGPLLVVTTSRSDSSVATREMVPAGSDGSSAAGDVVAATRAATEKETADAAAAKKAVDDTTTARKAADDATVAKKAADDAAAAKKAVDEAVAMKIAADDATVVKKAADEVAVVKMAADDTTVGSGSSSAPSTGAKRAIVPSGSTLLTKWRFLSSWKPRYVVLTFICHFLYCIVADDDVIVETVCILGHPIRAPGDVSLDEAMGAASSRRRSLLRAFMPLKSGRWMSLNRCCRSGRH